MSEDLNSILENKKKILKETEDVYNLSRDFYENILETFKTLYVEENGKLEIEHITAISKYLKELNDLIKTKSNIQNDIEILQNKINEFNLNKNKSKPEEPTEFSSKKDLLNNIKSKKEDEIFN